MGKSIEFSAKIWTAEQRRMARGLTDVLIPAVEVTFIGNVQNAIDFKKGGSMQAKSREKEYEGLHWPTDTYLT